MELAPIWDHWCRAICMTSEMILTCLSLAMTTTKSAYPWIGKPLWFSFLSRSSRTYRNRGGSTPPWWQPFYVVNFINFCPREVNLETIDIGNGLLCGAYAVEARTFFGLPNTWLWILGAFWVELQKFVLSLNLLKLLNISCCRCGCCLKELHVCGVESVNFDLAVMSFSFRSAKWLRRTCKHLYNHKKSSSRHSKHHLSSKYCSQVLFICITFIKYI